MYKLRERDIEIVFSDALDAIKFDQNDRDSPDYHDLGNMPRVDFIVETDKYVYFIEIKDPGRPDLEDAQKIPFLRKLESGGLEDSYVDKYTGTFLFRWAEGKLEKSVVYLILITLDDAQTFHLNQLLKKRFDRIGKSSPRRSRLPLASCEVLNLNSWPKIYPEWRITRTSTVEQRTN
jgi:hypothetical protein